MKSYLFITYPINQYYLSHIYEQLLAFEFLKNDLEWKTGNIGTGYIYVEWNKSVDKKIIQKLLLIPDVDSESLKKAQKVVHEEILQMIKIKPAMELSNFQTNSFFKIQKVMQAKISLKEIEDFIEAINTNEDHILILKNIYLIKEKKKKIEEKKKIKFPFYIDVFANKLTQVILKTNAQNVIDGYFFEFFGKNTEQKLKQIDPRIHFQSFIAPSKELFLTFSFPNTIATSKITKIIIEAANKVYKGPLMPSDDIDSLAFKEFQYYDWNAVLNKRIIKKRLAQEKISFKLLENTIILDF